MGVLRVFSMIVGILTNIIVVRMLGPADFGVYSLILYLAGIIGVFANLGLDQALPRYVAELKVNGNYGTIHTLVNKSLRYRFVILLILSSLLYLFSEPLAMFLNNPSMIIFLGLAGFIVIPQILLTIFTSTYSGLQNFRYITKLGILLSVLNFIFILVAIKYNFRIGGILAALFLSNLVILILYIQNFSEAIPKGNQTKDISFRERIKKFAIFSIAIGIVDYIVWNRSGVFFVGLYGTPDDAGYFSVAYNLPTMVFLNIPLIFFSALFPSFSEMYVAKGYKKIREILPKAMKIVSLLITPVFVFCIVFAKFIIEILYGSAYTPAVVPFQLLMVSAYATNVLFLATVSLYASERIDVILKLDSIALVFVILLSVFIVPVYGIIGAAIIFSIVQTITVIAQATVLSRISYTKIPANQLFQVLILDLILIFPFLIFIDGNGTFINLFESAIFYYIATFVLTTKVMLTNDEKYYFKDIPVFNRIISP